LVLSFGVSPFFLEKQKVTNHKEMEDFLSIITIIIGIGIVIVGFYTKKRHEDVINEKKL